MAVNKLFKILLEIKNSLAIPLSGSCNGCFIYVEYSAG
jgi:hypothetical protein